MGDIRLGTKCKNMIKRGLCLVLTLLMTVILASPVIAAPADNGSIEMVAAFDKSSYTAGETVKVSVTVYGSEFDAAGLHLTYDSNSLEYQNIRAGAEFNMPVRKVQESALEVTVQSTSVQNPGSEGIVIAEVTFMAMTGGSKSLSFSNGSVAYLEGKSATAYNGYQVLNVKSSVTIDAAADNALRKAKADAVEQLKKAIDDKLDAGVTVAQRQLLEQCLQGGIDEITMPIQRRL